MKRAFILKISRTDTELVEVLKMDVIDLFSGCGGLSLGLMKEGYTVKKAVEFDE